MIVLGWIINSVSPNIVSSIIYIDNAKVIWLDLRHRFSHNDLEIGYCGVEKVDSSLVWAKLIVPNVAT